MFSNWFRGRSSQSRGQQGGYRRARPLLECLEDRILLANQFVDLGPLRFGADNFIQNGNDYRALGTIELGFTPTTGEAFTPLVQIQGGVEFSTGEVSPAFTIQNAQVTTVVPGAPQQTLMSNATATYAVGNLAGAMGVTLNTGVQPFAVSGVPFIANNMRFDNPNGGTTTDAQIKLQGNVQFEKLDNLNVSVQNNNYVIFDETGLQLTGVQAALNVGAMKLGNLPINISNLGIGFSPSGNQFAFTGEFTFDLDGQTVGAGFTGAGLVITDGDITGVTMEITTDLNFDEVKITTDKLTVSYDDPTSTFTITGDASLQIEDQSLNVALGSANTYGLVIVNGTLERLDMALSGTFKLEDLEFQVGGPNNTNPIHIVYTKDNETFTLSGQVSVSELFDATVILGTLDQPGLVIAQGKFQGINITLSDINFGAFILDELKVEYTAEVISVTVDVTFPEGWTIGGSIQFVDGKLNEIGFDYQATNGEDGIEIGDTGIEITGFSGKVNNLENPSELVVSGSLTAAFISSDIITLEGDFLVSKDELVLDASGQMFGGLISSFSGTLVLDWGDQDYKLSVHAEWFDGTITFDGIFDLSNGGRDLYVRADAAVHIPDFVPFIGGKTLLSLNFVLEWHKDLPKSDSFVAAWIDLDLFFFHIDVGFKIDFDGGFSLIGNKQVDQIDSPPPAPVDQVFTYNIPFSVPENMTQSALHLRWDEAAGTQTFAVKKPDGTLIPASEFNANGLAVLPQFSTGKSYALGMVGSTSDAFVPLTPGEYQLVMTSTAKFDNTPRLTATYGQARPTIAVNSLPPNPSQLQISVPLSGKVITSLAPNTQVSLFSDNDSQGYDGRPLPNSQGLPLTVDSQGNWTVQGTWDTSGLLPLPYYAYAVINDGVNAPVYSAYSNSVLPSPPVYGTVANQNGDLVTGLRIVLEEQQQDGSWTVAASTVTSAEGVYTFDQVSIGQTYRLNLQIPPNAYLDQPSDATNPSAPFVYSGGSLAFSFQLKERAAIHGVVYEDTNGNGRRDPGEPGLSNWSVYLDSNNNGVQDADEDSGFTNSVGSYAFHNLLPTGDSSKRYTVRLALPSTYYQTGPQPIPPGTYTATLTGPFQVVEAQDFGVVAYSTISGNIAGYPPVNGGVSSTTQPLPGWTVELLQKVPPLVPATFAPPRSFSVGGGPDAVALGDLNGDGRLDAVVANSLSSWVSVLLNESAPGAPTPTFTPQADIFVGGGQTSVALADFNKDGQLDIVVAVSELLGSSVSVLLNTTARGASAPSFASAQSFTALGATAVAVADFNGDGRPDLAVAGGDTVAVLLNTTGAGATTATFAAEQTFNVGFVGLSGSSLAVEDLNGDGRPDLIVTVNDSQAVAVLVNTTAAGAETASFAPRQTFGTGSQPQAVAVADFNGDGRPDLAVGNFSSDKVSVLFNTTTAAATLSFAAGQTFAVVNSPSSLAAADFNHDGRPDLAVANFGAGQVTVLLNTVARGDATPAFTALQPLQVPESSFLAVGDLNGDSMPDLAVGGYSLLENDFAVLLNSTTPITPAPPFPTQEASDTGFQLIGSTTTDASGNYSFGNLRAGEYSVRQHLQPGWREISPFDSDLVLQPLGNFQVPGPDPIQPDSVTTGDFNQDGYLDVAVLLQDTSPLPPDEYAGFNVWVYLGGSGGLDFVNPLEFSVFINNTFPLVNPTKLVAADVNGDGWPDLVIMDPSTNTIYLLTNQQSRSTPSLFDTGSVWGSLIPASNTGNANPVDLVRGSKQYPLTALFNANDSGEVSFPLVFNPDGSQSAIGQGSPQSGSARNLATGDINGDGAVDYFFGNTLLLSPSYQPTTLSGLGSDGVTVMVGDINRDGRLDLGQFGTNGLFTYALQQTDGSFQVTSTQVGSAGTVAGAVLQDMNGDLLPDLVWVADGVGAQALFVALQKDGFSPAQQYSFSLAPSGQGPLALATGDFNNDGLVDVAVTDESTGNLVVFQNASIVQPAAITIDLNGSTATGQNFINARVGQVAGVVFDDVNLNGRQDPNEPGIAGASVYLDLDRNGSYDSPSDPRAVTSGAGVYSFAGLEPGSYRVGVVATEHRVQALQNAPSFVETTVAFGQQQTHADFATTARMLARIANQAVEVGSSLNVLMALLPATASAVVFSLEPGAPAGTTIDPYTGAFHWQPTAAQAGGTYPVTVRVRHPQEPLRTETQTFWVRVRSVPTTSPAPGTPTVLPGAPRAVTPRDVRHVRSLFRNILRRTPRRSELRYWIDRLRDSASLREVAGLLWKSRGHRRLQVEALFQTYLHRRPGRVERRHWVRALITGLSEAEMIQSILTSGELRRTATP